MAGVGQTSHLCPPSELKEQYRIAMSASFARNCRKVVCIGRNYAEHVKELNNQTPMQPFYFLKPPSSMLLPGQGPILCPKGVKLHYEVELALVMGKHVRDLHPNDHKGALAAIEGKDAASFFRVLILTCRVRTGY